eukprot:2053285-Rhodomonas_salina.1
MALPAFYEMELITFQGVSLASLMGPGLHPSMQPIDAAENRCSLQRKRKASKWMQFQQDTELEIASC